MTKCDSLLEVDVEGDDAVNVTIRAAAVDVAAEQLSESLNYQNCCSNYDKVMLHVLVI